MRRILPSLILAIVVGSPAWAQQKIDRIVARVNSDVILQSDVEREMELRRTEMSQQGVDAARLQQYMAEQSKTVLRDLIDRALLLQVAKDAGLNADLDVLKAMEELREDQKFDTMEELERAIVRDYGDVEEFKNNIRTKFLTQQVIEHEVYGRIVITNEEMKKYYDEHYKEFDKPAGVRLSEIAVLVDRRLPDQVATQRKKIEEAEAALKRGDDFAEVADKYSEVSTAPNGGDLGFIAGNLKEQVNETVATALENLQKNQTTDILEFNDAFIIYKVTDKHDGGILSFDLAQQYIWQALMGEIAPGKVRDFLTELRDQGFVDVKEGFEDTGAKVDKTASAKP